jgi:ketosteroid isomerase-like protein
MSQENLELARRFLDATAEALASYWQEPLSIAEALRTGDLTPEGELAFKFLHPDVVWNAGGFGTFQGREEMAAGWDDILDVADNYSVLVRELREGRDDLVYAAVEREITATGSGMETSFPIFAVLRIEDGLITRVDEYADRHEALETAGLSE